MQTLTATSFLLKEIVHRDDPLPPQSIKLKLHCSFCTSKLGVATLPEKSILVVSIGRLTAFYVVVVLMESHLN